MRRAARCLNSGSRQVTHAARRARHVATIDKRGARHVGMSDKRRAAIGETTTSCYALRLLRRFATGILEIGSRSERNVATIDKRGARTVGMTDKRRAAIGEATASCYALRFLRRFATGILEIGSRSEKNVVRVARIVAAIDKRCARIVGTTGKRHVAIEETTTSCYALRLIAAASATGILEIGSRSERGTSRRSTTRGACTKARRDERQEARGDRGGDHELLRLALIAALRDGDFGDRQSVREERRDDRQEGREARRDERQESRSDRD